MFSNVLKNAVEKPAHGSGEMPFWGPIFETMNSWKTLCPSMEETPVSVRITSLTNYLKSIQRNSLSPPYLGRACGSKGRRVVQAFSQPRSAPINRSLLTLEKVTSPRCSSGIAQRSKKACTEV
jgi:hypothetical protein